MHIVQGFSKLSRREKLQWIKKQSDLSQHALETMDSHLHPDQSIREIYQDLSENTISMHYLPLGLAPNFLINGDLMTLPMVTEESSVVAAASRSCLNWNHGAF